MTRKDLARLVAEEYGKKYSLKAINEIIDSAFYHIGCALIQSSAPNQNNTVLIQNFGTFEVKERAPRKCINPRTGKEMELPAIKRVTFRQSKPLKEALNR